MKLTLYVGIDVSQSEHVVCTMTMDGRAQGRLRVPNDRTGIDQLIEWLATQADDVDHLAVGLESTSVYHWPLFEVLAPRKKSWRLAGRR